jgi:hypothetical protein
MHIISLSHRTVTRNIDELTDDLEQSLRDRAAKLETFSLATGKHTDMSDKPQLAALLRGVNTEFNIIEEMLGIQPMKDIVTVEDIFQEITLNVKISS